MKHSITKRFITVSGTLAAILSLATLPASAVATRSGTTPATTNTAASDAGNQADQAKIKAIINKGDREINRRLTTLNTLSNKINGAQKLTSSDKNSLSNEVSTEISGLTALKTKLDADSDLATAKADAQSIFSDYRVYALVVPKVQLVKAADDQQVAEGKLTDLATKLQSRLTNAKNSGKDVTDLQNTLNDMTAKTTAAQQISSSVESSIINLQPSDYNSDHQLLSGYRDKLKTAQSNIKAATTDSQTVVNGLKKL
ncbi:MAG TPA: hypothetical protein VN554_02715 [Verrucomicrobiae bacterium]|nr:hypothetical protein [Verrucomicrobiae bacterium]